MPRSQHSDRYRRFCASLIDARRRAGLTQAKVAKKLKKPQSYVSKYEKGERRLDFVELLDVAAAIGVPPLTLLRKLAKETSR